MQKKLWKNARRVLAGLMALTMIIMNMSNVVVYAEETSDSTVATEWIFSSEDFYTSVAASRGDYTYNGLEIKGGQSHDNTYLYLYEGATVAIPVEGNSVVTVNGHYAYSFYFEGNEDNVFTEGSTVPHTYTYTGDAGYVTITATSQSYLTSIKVEAVDEKVPQEPDLTVPESVAGKIDVWDFAAEKLDESVYTNKLSADVINSWYGDSVAPGTEGVALPAGTFSAGELVVHTGSKTNNRIRTINTAISRHDQKSLSVDGVTYSGYFYSNSSGNANNIYVGITAKAGDILTFVVSSNGGNSTINFVDLANPDVVLATDVYEASNKAEVMSFYAPADGTYKIYSSDEKLVVARVYRESTNAVTVSGNVVAPEELSGYRIAFTNQKNGAVTTAAVNNGTYSVTLNDQYTYDVALVDANGYIITSAATVEVAKGSAAVDFPITVTSVSMVTVSGAIAGLSAEELAKAKISFASDEIYQPELTFEGMNYTAKVEIGVTYNVVVEGINDYTLVSPTTVSVSEDTSVDMTFEKKPVHAVTINPTGATVADLAEATFNFTNLKEEGYVYTFTGTEGIALRDGVYSVVVENSGIFVQQLTSNLTVNGAAVTKDITFNSDIKEWIFTDASFTSGKYANAGTHTYNGLTFTNGKSHNSTYLYMGAGSITVPVKGSCTVTVNSCYEYSYYFADQSEASVGVKTGSTGQIDSYSYTYEGGPGSVIITVLGSSYINSIVVTEGVPFKEVVTVGETGCDYTTINDALDAVRAMTREAGERVTIEIQPGNYEEMLVVDVPNVTLKNASATPSIETKDKGVNIDENAVRITSYYGHGYTYYSMGSDCKYDAKLLAVNKENGYASFENPGSGTTNGSYWNATVVVTASGFEAEGIIFENSFNQYVSEKAANDVIVAQSSAKEGSVPRASMKAGDTTVQDKKYVERAAALAIANNCKEVSFDNCKFIGRQDTLYGGTDVTAAFYDCAIYGGTDYIFGAMTAVFAKCDLVFNTSEDSNDVGYITAAQTKSGRGMLLYNCKVTSTVPGVDTASEYPSKAGYLGRPWQANTGEAVFYNTIIEATDSHWYKECPSLIQPVGWLSSLSGESVLSAEYGTYEMAANVDNQSARASWASTLTEPVLADGTTISVEAFLGEWDAFAGKDMTIELLSGKVDNTPEEDTSVSTSKYEFDVTTLTAAADKEAVTEGTTFADGYFKAVGTITKRTSSSTGKVTSIELGKASSGAIQFTVTGTADVEIVMSSTGGSNTSPVALVDASGAVVANNENITTVSATSKTTMTYTGLAAGTYQVVSPKNADYNRGARLYSIVAEQTASGSRPARADWAHVTAPEITAVALDSENANNIIVSVKGFIGYDGADSIAVKMLDATGEVVNTASYATDSTECMLTFTPEVSGKYTFAVEMVRKDEDAKVGAETKEFDFTLPLVAPTITGAFNAGEGLVEVEWNAVKEAESYEVTVDGTDITYTTENLIQIIEGLTVGEAYTIKVAAVRGEEKVSASIEITVSGEKEVKWYFAAYGSSTNTKNNGYEVLEDGSVRVYSTSGKGKIVPGSTDGLAYYYTTIDPDTTNFTLSATAVVNDWTLSNGQEGFGIMASDRAGKHGDATAFWNNSYMAIVSKVEYYYDTVAGEVTDDTSASKVSMKLGVGAQEKVGVTAENLAAFEANDTATINEYFSSTMDTLESSCGAMGAGTYNMVGNYTGVEPTGTIDDTVTEFKFTIQKNNTGYFVSYTDAEGNINTQKYYDTEALSQIEEDSVCVGFFASRNADITFKDITFTTIAPEDDVLAEERPVTLVTPNYAITSATVANKADYELVYVGNADGKLVIKDNLGKVLLEKADVKANEKVALDVKLVLGNNPYDVAFTPDPNYVPGEYQKLASYDAVSFTHVVNYKSYGKVGEALYVSPKGSASGDGTKANPLDIYTAVKYVQAGQTIVVMEGTYNLKSTVKVERGIDGTAENMIYMVADPEAKTRPVFDFGGRCAGMILAGDYWYFQGFDVTKSADAQKGIQVSGNNNVLDQIHAYRNGNTGIQISRYLSTDAYEDWPANNLILNCTSYLNADKGYEDADGFAAKLTVGDGNVFDGCIAYYNADDGWDLFAKVQTGCIGAVTIQNSIAYKNGYVLDDNGNEINAGNGNGFKMGGDSMTGGHILKNSAAFMNKAKGIDSNSCPDIKVYSSIAFNNGSYNVAFYTNTAANTDYLAYGVVSYRTENLTQEEQLKLKGTQDEAKVYGVTNFFWDVTSQAAKNTQGTAVEADWFESLEFAGVSRNADGTINLNGFLTMTDGAEVKAGLIEELATASGNITIGKETSGTTPDDEEEKDDTEVDTEISVDTETEVDTEISVDTETEVDTEISVDTEAEADTETTVESNNSIIEDFIQNIENALNKRDEATEEENESLLLEGLRDLVESVKVVIEDSVVEKVAQQVQKLVEKLLTGDVVTGISKETTEKVLAALESGATIVSNVVAEPVEVAKVPNVERGMVEDALKKMENAKTGILQYLDLSVLLCTDNGEVLGTYDELPEPLSFTVSIPEGMETEGKTFVVIRVHGEEVTVLDTVMNGDGTLTFETDRFSTYALAYKEDIVAESAPETTEQGTVVEDAVSDLQEVAEEEESDNSISTIAVIAVLLLAVSGLIITKRKQFQSK